MIVRISLEYFASTGENLAISSSSGVIPMFQTTSGRWQAELHSKPGKFNFEVFRNGKSVRRDWGSHLLPNVEADCLDIRACWNDRPVDSPFYSSMFTNVIFKRPEADKSNLKPRGYAPQNTLNAVFSIKSALVRPDECIAMTGSGPIFDDWKKVLPLSDSAFPDWSIALKIERPFEYKFVIADSKTLAIKHWEVGPNRFFSNVPLKDTVLVIADEVPVFNATLWKGVGTAVPVFSLRTEDSFGIGEFLDIKKLVDWAAITGQCILQLLPVNDTAMNGTWEDSYPYNANSTFALHPQFINLLSAGVPETREYKTLQKSLNSLEKVDYERVNTEKKRLLRAMFDEKGEQITQSREFRSFYKSNKTWLKPYAVWCALRDEYGTPDSRLWGRYAKYSPRKIDAYCRRNAMAYDFYCVLQFIAGVQLKQAVEYAHSRGVALKGDIPIGISPTSVDAWVHPELFNMDSQAGAPPDAFSAQGQNWGFPTYDWKKMAEDGYAWWKARLSRMGEFFDAFRIDHILGFFRIWEIPKPHIHGLSGHFNPALPYRGEELEALGFELPDTEGMLGEDVLFVADPYMPQSWHPHISGHATKAYASLTPELKHVFDSLYEDFFYHRHNDFWKASAMAKLPALLDSTGMLACGEDLGMIPECVPEVEHELNILSLEIQRMPKAFGQMFANPADYPYYSVCTTGTHDTSTIRGWWEEDSVLIKKFYHEMLHHDGEVPLECSPELCKEIIHQHLNTPSMLTILPLQDWLSIDATVRYQGNPKDERINIPAVSRHYWRWRMHMSLERIIDAKDFNVTLLDCIKNRQK